MRINFCFFVYQKTLNNNWGIKVTVLWQRRNSLVRVETSLIDLRDGKLLLMCLAPLFEFKRFFLVYINNFLLFRIFQEIVFIKDFAREAKKKLMS